MKKKILVIDPAKGIREVLEKILVDGGHDVFTVPSALRGNEQLNSLTVTYDLVTINLTPGKVNARQFLQAVRMKSDIPIILITGGPVDTSEMLAVGFADVIRKPFGRDELLTAVAKVLPTQ